MRNYIKLTTIVIILAILAAGATRWQGRLFESILAYRSFLTNTRLVSHNPVTPQTSRVVLVIIGGLGFDALQVANTPTLDRLRESGASALVQSEAPSYAHPTWLSLLSGVSPRFNNGLLFDIPSESTPLSPWPTLFHSAHQQELGTGLIGPIMWRSVISADVLHKSVYTLFDDAQGDQQLVDNLPAIIDDETLDLLLIYFSQVDRAALTQGGLEAGDALKAIEQIDAHLDVLVRLLNLEQTTLIITADHGHIASGGYGGQDLSVLRQPMVMVGQGVVPGSYSAVNQTDIAPTITALLGLSFPAYNQGRPLIEMLQLSERQRAEIALLWTEQQLNLAQAYLSIFGSPEPNFADFEKAQAFYERENFDGATQLAELLVVQAKQMVDQAESARLAREKRLRLPLIGGLLVGLLGFSLWARSDLWWQALLTSGLIVASYHALYRLEKLPYSFSAMTDLSQLGDDIQQRMAISLLLGSIFFIILLALRQYTDFVTVLISCAETVFFSVLGFLWPALLGFWQYGLAISWFFPDMGLLYLHLSGLIQAHFAIILGLGIPIIILPTNYFIQRWIAIYQHRRILQLRTRTTDP